MPAAEELLLRAYVGWLSGRATGRNDRVLRRNGINQPSGRFAEGPGHCGRSCVRRVRPNLKESIGSRRFR